MLDLFAKFDNDVLHCLEQCTEHQLHQWQVGKHSSVFVMEVLASAPYFSHATAAYIASASISLPGAFPPTTEFTHLQTAIAMFNQQVAEEEALTTVSVLLSPPRQHLLSEKVEKLTFSSLLHNATTATKARLLAESVPQAHAWLRTVPSPGLGLALEPDETHILLKWWLGLPLCNLDETCPYCSSQLDHLGHHALTCRYAGDVVTRHNIRDCIADFCRRAHLSPLMEQGCGIAPVKEISRPADILIPNWLLSQSAAFDIKVIHLLNNSLISDAGQTSGASAAVSEQEKLDNHALGCVERGWICVPLVVEAYGGWGITQRRLYQELLGAWPSTPTHPILKR